MVLHPSFSFSFPPKDQTPLGVAGGDLIPGFARKGQLFIVTGYPTSIVSLSNHVLTPEQSGATHAFVSKIILAAREANQGQPQPIQAWLAPNIHSPDPLEQKGAINLARAINTCRELPNFNDKFVVLVPDLEMDQSLRDRMLMKSVPEQLLSDANFSVLSDFASRFQLHLPQPHSFAYVAGNAANSSALYGAVLQMRRQGTTLVSETRNLDLQIAQSQHAHNFEQIAAAIQTNDSEALRQMGFQKMGALEYADRIMRHLHEQGRDPYEPLRFDSSR